MSVEQFERELRALMHCEPFHPFVVKLAGGRCIFIDSPSIAFGGGRAGYIDPSYEIESFDCEQVVEFRLATEEPAR